jgi:hypothetical protein
MKTLTMFLVLAISTLLVGPGAALGKQRLDVAMEGPWIFYVQQNFPTSSGPSTVLIAVAPKVDHHYDPVFSSGDGGQFKPGVYCVMFDKKCIPTASNTTSLTYDTYPNPNPVPLKNPAWDWTKFKASAYIVILPMPDYYSADGKDSLSFEDTLPTATTSNPPTVAAQNYAIGVVLHYLNGPARLDLYSCSNPSDASSCTSPAFRHDQENSGTLRITIRSDETASNTDDCKYHVHGAYHSMLGLVDPKLNYNSDRKYIDVPLYLPACTPGDPQQDPYPATSASVQTHSGDANPDINVPVELDMLVQYLDALGLSDRGSQIALPQLTDMANQLRGKFPKLSDLSELRTNLRSSQDGLKSLLDGYQQHSSLPGKDLHKINVADLRLRLKAALLKEGSLEQDSYFETFSIFNGKDCRAAMVLIQQ